MLPFVNCYPCFLFCLSKLRSWWNEEPWQKMSGKKCCTANWISLGDRYSVKMSSDFKQGVLLDWRHALKLTIFERWSQKVDQKERCVPQKLGAKSQMHSVCHVDEWQGKALQGRGGEGCWLRQPSTSPSNISRPVLHSQYLCSYFYEGYRHKISEGQKIV